MSIENQTEQNEERDEGEEVLPAPETGIALVREEPKAPKEMKAEEAETLRRRARELAKQLESASGSRELEAIDSISNLGIQAQRSGASDMNLLRARVGEMMTQEGPAGTISKDMAELRVALNQINPHELDKKGVLARLASAGPLGRGVGSVRKILEQVAIRYEPVSQQITVIEGRWKASCLPTDPTRLRMKANLSALRAILGINSQIWKPGMAVEIGMNSPRMSTGASGFRSIISICGGPPSRCT